MYTISDYERTIHVLSFVPRENVWALECRLYVDASNYQILRYEGIGKNNYIENRIRGVKHVLPADYSFEVNYRHDKGFAEIESVHFNVGFTDNGKRYTTSGMMYNVDDRVFRLKKTVKFDDNLMQEIIWNVEGEVLLKYDDRRMALEVFSKMDSVRQEGIRTNLMTRIEEQKKAIEMFGKGEMPDLESNPSIESLKKVLDEYMEFAEILDHM